MNKQVIAVGTTGKRSIADQILKLQLRLLL